MGQTYAQLKIVIFNNNNVIVANCRKYRILSKMRLVKQTLNTH